MAFGVTFIKNEYFTWQILRTPYSVLSHSCYLLKALGQHLDNYIKMSSALVIYVALPPYHN